MGGKIDNPGYATGGKGGVEIIYTLYLNYRAPHPLEAAFEAQLHYGSGTMNALKAPANACFSWTVKTPIGGSSWLRQDLLHAGKNKHTNKQTTTENSILMVANNTK